MSGKPSLERLAIIDDSPAPLDFDFCEPMGLVPVVLGTDAFKGGLALSLDDWFNTVVLGWLREIAPAPRLLIVNANLKFRPETLRTDWSGVTVAAHVRYTRTLPEAIRFAHIVLYSFAPDLLDAASVPERLIAYSAGVTFARAPLPRFSKAVLERLATRRITAAEGRSGVLAMEVMAGEKTEAYAHSLRNRMGVAKVLREFAPDVIGLSHPLCAAAEHETSLEQKRVLFLHPELAARHPVTDRDRTELRNAAKDRVFLQIDDEHDRGWCLALNAGLSGGEPGAGVGPVRPISTLADALKNVEQARALWDDALDRWERAMTELKDAPFRIEKAKRRKRAATEKLAAAEEEAKGIERTWMLAAGDRTESIKRLTALWPMFSDLALDVVDSSTSVQFGLPTPGTEILTKLGVLQELSTAHQMYERANLEFREAEHTATAAQEKVRQAGEKHRDATRELESAEEGYTLATGGREKARRDLDTACPWSVVFLDLRLEAADEERSLNELSGWQVFDELQRQFPHLPVCILTASQKAPNAGRAYHGGATAYWIKGVSTGREMLVAVQECLKRDRLAPLWRKICLVSRIPVVQCRRYDGRDWFDVPRDQGDEARMLIQKLIEECFWTFWRHSVWNRPSRLQANPWESVVLNLGIIQEMRFSIDTRRLPPGTTQDALERELDATDMAVRRLRNWLAHRRGAPPPDWPDQANQLTRAMFEHTLEALTQP